MEVTGIVKDGRVVLPPTVHLEEGAVVRVIVESEGEPQHFYEREPLSLASVLADIAWATGKRFAP